jgi:replication fork protection complex subunit Tof1/Swi1
LGGTGTDEYGGYVLGDDALACLRDIRRWLRLYDEKLNRLDVARCLAEANLIAGDILPILANWPEYMTDDRVKAKLAFYCRMFWMLSSKLLYVRVCVPVDADH